MYYLLKGRLSDEGGARFAWVIEAESEDEAIAQLTETEVIEEIREISVEERIEREKNELSAAIKNDYMARRYGDYPVREFCNIYKEMKSNHEMYYKALYEFNTIHRLVKRLYQRREFKKMNVEQFSDMISKLVDVKSEEELSALLQSVGVLTAAQRRKE